MKAVLGHLRVSLHFHLHAAPVSARFAEAGVQFDLYTHYTRDKSWRGDLAFVERLIVSPESMCRVTAMRPPFGLAIIDESESVLAQFASATMDTPRDRRFKSWGGLVRTLIHCDQAVFADGHIGARTVRFVEHLVFLRKDYRRPHVARAIPETYKAAPDDPLEAGVARLALEDASEDGTEDAATAADCPSVSCAAPSEPAAAPPELLYFHNAWVPTRRDATVFTAPYGTKPKELKEHFMGHMGAALRGQVPGGAPLRCVLFTNSKRFAKEAFETLKAVFPDRTERFRLYTADGDKDDAKDFQGVNEAWVKYDVVIYSPVLTCGVSFDVEHFHRVYAFLSDDSCGVRTCMQAIHRARKLHNNELFVFVHHRPYGGPPAGISMRAVYADLAAKRKAFVDLMQEKLPGFVGETRGPLWEERCSEAERTRQERYAVALIDSLAITELEVRFDRRFFEKILEM